MDQTGQDRFSVIPPRNAYDPIQVGVGTYVRRYMHFVAIIYPNQSIENSLKEENTPGETRRVNTHRGMNCKNDMLLQLPQNPCTP